MSPGEVKNVLFSVIVPETALPASWKNIASVSWEPKNPEDDRPEEPSNEVEIYVGSEHVSIVKEQERNDSGQKTKDFLDVVSGDTITYYLEVTSDGEQTAKDVIVTDEIPQEPKPLELISDSINENGSLGEDGITITWKL